MKFFVDKNYKIFFLFTLELFEICNCWNLQSPCPKIYQYNRDQKYGIFGEIFVKSPSETEIKLDVQISVPNHISQVIFLLYFNYFSIHFKHIHLIIYVTVDYPYKDSLKFINCN